MAQTEFDFNVTVKDDEFNCAPITQAAKDFLESSMFIREDDGSISLYLSKDLSVEAHFAPNTAFGMSGLTYQIVK